MITYKELLSGNLLSDVPIEHQQNLQELLKRINVVRVAYGKPMTVTSGYRDIQHHKDIYRKKGVPDNKIPMQSRHLYGMAVDISDPNQELQAWCLSPAGLHILETVGLWCEDFSATKNWAHFQIVPPKSGKRFFLP